MRIRAKHVLKAGLHPANQFATILPRLRSSASHIETQKLRLNGFDSRLFQEMPTN